MPRYGILGPPVLWRDGASVPVVAARDRTVLAVLLLSANRVVTVDQLADAVWPGLPPRSGRGQIHGCVFRLRRLLDGAVLQTHSPGYLMRVDDGELDAAVFTTRLAQARAARAAEQLDASATLLRDALDLWRGPALASVEAPAVRADAARLDELRLTAWEEWFDVELAQGQGHVVIGELASLASRYPLRERYHAQLMIGLYQAGRQTEALRVYERARALLAEQLGVEPGPELTEAHARIIAHDLALASPAATETGTGPASGQRRPAAPTDPPREQRAAATIPADPGGFVGRRDQLAWLDKALAAVDEPHTGPVICTVTGMAGVGKTSLVVHWAHRVKDRLRGSCLYLNLRGFDPAGSPLNPTAATRFLLDAFCVPAESIPASPLAQTVLYRSLLAARPTLLVLDNARDADQVRPLLPDSPRCLVLITSRNQLTDLVASVGAAPLPLDVLSTAEATELLTRRLGVARVAAELAATDEIARSCGRLPLALALVAARAATHPDFPLTDLAGELRDADGWFDTVDGQSGSPGVRGMFSSSYLTLQPDAAHLFRLLSLHPGPQVTVPAAASLLGSAAGTARRLLAELASAHMVMEQAPGRFVVHDLLRAYAAELSQSVDPQRQRRAAQRRLLDHYLHSADAADQLVDPFRSSVVLDPPEPGVTVVQLTDADHASAWFVTEHAALVSAACQAAVSGFDGHAWQIVWAHADSLYWQGRWHDLAVTHQAALEAARRLRSVPGQAHAHRGLAGAATALGRHDDAYLHLMRALDLFTQTGNQRDQAHMRRNIALVLQNAGKHAEALHHLGIAAELCAAIDDESGQARALHASGLSHAHLDDHRQAIACCRRALALQRKIGDHAGEAGTWGVLGYTYHRLGEYALAIRCLERASNRYGALGDRADRGTILSNLGDAYQAVGDTRKARTAWYQALELLAPVSDPSADELRTKLRRHSDG